MAQRYRVACTERGPLLNSLAPGPDNDAHCARPAPGNHRAPPCLGSRINQSALVPWQPSRLRRIWVLGAVAKQMIRQHAGHHRLPDRHRANSHAWIVPATG
jgi:hypothetical protein